MELMSKQVLDGRTYATVHSHGKDYSVWGNTVAVNYRRWAGLGMTQTARVLNSTGPLARKILAFVKEQRP